MEQIAIRYVIFLRQNCFDKFLTAQSGQLNFGYLKNAELNQLKHILHSVLVHFDMVAFNNSGKLLQTSENDQKIILN